MHLEIITPEHKIFSGEVTAVQLPGLDGLFQVLTGHAPIISALKSGSVKVDLTESFERTEKTSALIKEDAKNNKTVHVDVKGGVAEMLNNKMIILAE